MSDPGGSSSAEWAAFFAAGLAAITASREFASTRSWTAFLNVVAAVLALYAAGMAPSVREVIGDALTPALQALFGEVAPYQSSLPPT
jgi:hypothetical protein